MDPAWREHLEALKRFNEWENEQLRNQPPDYASALAWLSEVSELVERLGSYRDRLADREEHLQDLLAMRAALARARTGVDADLILAALPYEVAAIRRAVPVSLGAKKVSLCSPEDLIVRKLSSDRAQDAADVEGIMTRQAGRLDLAYLRPLVRDLAAGLERPEIVEFFEKTLRKTVGRAT